MAQSIGLPACVILVVPCGGKRDQIIYLNKDPYNAARFLCKFAISVGDFLKVYLVRRIILSHAHAPALGCDFEGTTELRLFGKK